MTSLTEVKSSPFISAQIVEMIIILSSASLLICLLLLVVITRLKMWSDRRNQSRASDTPSCSGSETKYKKADSWPKVYRGHNTARVYAVIADVKDLHKAGEREEMSSPKPKNTEHTAVNNRKSSATAAKTRKHIAKMNGTMHLHQTSKLKEKNELTEIVSEKEKKTELNGVPHQPKEGDAQDKLGFHETIADVKPDCTEQPEPNSKTDVKNTPEETKIAEQDSLSELHQTTEVTDQTELNGTPEIVQPPEVSGMTQHNDGSELNKTNEPGEVNEINAALDLSVQQDIRRLSGSSVFQLTPDGSRKAETYLRKHSYSLSTESISGYSGRFLPKSSERTIQSGRRGGTPIGPDGRPIWRV